MSDDPLPSATRVVLGRAPVVKMPSRNRVVQVFGRSPVVLPVVHPVRHAAARESLRVVAASGAPGAFLIDQGTDEAGVLSLAREARERHPGLWLGVNLLSRRPAAALAVALRALGGQLDGLWSDDAGVDERDRVQPHAEDLVDAREATGWEGLYFGGVAFRYQREVPLAGLPAACARAQGYVDVVCTSGPRTGEPPCVGKVLAMRAGCGARALLDAPGGNSGSNPS